MAARSSARGAAAPCAAQSRPRQVLPYLLAGAAILLAVPDVAGASDASLRRTLRSWSQVIARDARSVQLASARRHPRRLAYSAVRFRADALRARRALAAATPSSVRGRRAQRLALAAFSAYAIAGREWALSGRARLRKQRAAAIRHAALAAGPARRGNLLLVGAGRLLR